MAEYKGATTSLPESGKGGDWKPKLPLWRRELVNEAGEEIWHEYADVGSSTSSNLKRDYGVDAKTITVKDKLHMFVRFPTTKDAAGNVIVDEQAVYDNRVGFKANKGKLGDRPSTPAGNGASDGDGNTPETTAETPAAAGGRRSR